MKVQIKHRWSLAVLFEAEISDDIEEPLRIRAALEIAVKARANLDGANLAGANLDGANLAGAYLARADLAGASLDGAKKSATDEEAEANLDKVREIILDNQKRLNMGHWHGDEEWKARSCAEETLCGTTHCLAGWLQVCATDKTIREDLQPQIAGMLQAPIASKMFYRDNSEALEWLRDRKYVAEMAEARRRQEARAKAKAEAQP